MLSTILEQDVDIMLFSAYMWNMEIIINLCKAIKRKRKTAFNIIGGPQVSLNSLKIMEQNPEVDIIVKSEGEKPLYTILNRIKHGDPQFGDIPGITYRQNKNLVDTPLASPLPIENMSYPLYTDDLFDDEKIDYETSRGCPFSCNYCSWDREKKLRMFPIEKVKKDLKKLFALPKLQFIEVVDSNILLNKKRGIYILQYINELNHERIKQGHEPVFPYFETNMEYLDDDLIDEIIKLPTDYRKGHTINIGLQSINKETLKTANRRFNKEKFTTNYKKFIQKGFEDIRIEIILGLPGDNLERYKETLDYLLSEINVSMFCAFQYVSVPGSHFSNNAAEYGLVCEDRPPYMLIKSNSFSLEELREATELTYYILLIFHGIRRIKKNIDMRFKKNKIYIYEKIAIHFNKNYGASFHPQDYLYEVDIFNDIKKMNSPEYQPIRMAMMKDALQIIKTAGESDRLA
jgi:radical SAM superfamily enzyme YgiQ (UPF0313 family)